jgi:hypothetical protein
MPSRTSRIGSLFVGGWEWARRWILLDVLSSALIGVVTCLVLLAFGVGARSFLALLGLPVTLLATWLVGTAVAFRANANFVAEIQRLGPDIHFDLNRRPTFDPYLPARGRCWVTDPKGATSEATIKPVGATFWVRYPSDFPEAPPIVPGRYRVTWAIEREPGTEKWRVLLTKQYTEPG